MEIENIKKIIADSPLDESDKFDLIAKLEAGSNITEILVQIKRLIDKKEKDLDEKNPEGLAEYKQIQDDYVTEVNSATDTFNKSMDQINAETETVSADFFKKLDEVRLKELKQNP